MQGIQTTDSKEKLIELWRSIGADPKNYREDAKIILTEEALTDAFSPKYESFKAFCDAVAARTGGKWNPALGIAALDTSVIDSIMANYEGVFDGYLDGEFKIMGKDIGYTEESPVYAPVYEVKKVLFSQGIFSCEQLMTSYYNHIYGIPCSLGVGNSILSPLAKDAGLRAETLEEHIFVRRLIAEVEEAQKRENARQESFKKFWHAKAKAFRMKYKNSLNIRYTSDGQEKIKPITWSEILQRVSKIESLLSTDEGVDKIFKSYLPTDLVDNNIGDNVAAPFAMERNGDYLSYYGYDTEVYTPGKFGKYGEDKDGILAFIANEKKKDIGFSYNTSDGSFSVDKKKDEGFHAEHREVNVSQALRFYCAYVRFVHKHRNELSSNGDISPDNALGIYLQDPSAIRDLDYSKDEEMQELLAEFKKEAKCLRDMPDEALLIDTARSFLAVTLDKLADEQIVRLNKQESALRAVPITLSFVFFAGLLAVYSFFRYTLIDQAIGQYALTALVALLLASNIMILGVIKRNYAFKRPYAEKHVGRKWALSVGIITIVLFVFGCYFMGRYDAYDDTYYYNRRADHTMVVAGLRDREATSLVIPEYYEDYRIIGIAKNSFLIPNEVRTVKAGENCESIGSYAFFWSDKLESVELNASTLTLGAHAFERNPSLEYISFNGSVTEIPNYCFKGCSSLYEFRGGGNVTTVGKSAFEGCGSLDVTAALPAVQVAGNKAFKGSAVTNVPIAMYQSVGDYAFAECNELTSLKCDALSPELSLGVGAFSSCENLTDVDLTFSDTALPKYLFRNSASLMNVKILGNVTNIDKGILYGCKVDNVTLPYLGDAVGSFKDMGYVISAEGKKTLRYITLLDSSEMVIVKNGFKDCESLISLKCNTITKVEDAGFKNCESFENISFDGITSIGKEAFANTALTTYASGPEVVEIKDKAFANCRYLTSVTILDPSLSLGKKIFTDCESLSTFRCASLGSNEKPQTLSSVLGTSVKFVETVEVTDQTVFADSAFEGSESLRFVSLNDSVTEIPKNCFKNCYELLKVTAPNVTVVRKHAFENCHTLSTLCFEKLESIEESAYKNTDVQQIDYSETLSEIGANAFAGSSLVRLSLPSTSLNIGKNAFNGCDDLINVSLGRMCYQDTPMTASFVFGSASKCIISVTLLAQETLAESAFAGCESLEIMNLAVPIDTIPKKAFFECYYLTRIQVEGLTSIGESAFYRCYAIDRVPCESTLASIDKKAFSESGITTFRGGESLVFIGKSAFADAEEMLTLDVSACWNLDIEDKAFADCDKMYEVKLYALGSQGNERTMKAMFGESRRSIESLQIACPVSKKNCFSDCESLSEMILSDLQEEIPDGAFSGCKSLRNVYGRNVHVIGNEAFKDCESFYTYTFSDLTKIGAYAFYNTSIPSFVSDASLTEIGKSAFEKSMVSQVVVDTPNAVIGQYAFANCDYLYNITVNSIGTESSPKPLSYILDDGVNYIESVKVTNQSSMAKSAFEGADDLYEVEYVLPVTNIAKKAFKNCSWLRAFDMTSAITIGDSAFENCEDLWTVVFSDSLTELGECAFKNCSGIKEITLPDSLKTVEYGAFMNCTNLSTVNFGTGIRSIEKRAFSGCSNLTVLQLNEGLEKIKKLAFHGCTELRCIWMPSSLKKIAGLAFFDYAEPLNVWYEGGESDWNGISKNFAFLGTTCDVDGNKSASSFRSAFYAQESSSSEEDNWLDEYYQWLESMN